MKHFNLFFYLLCFFILLPSICFFGCSNSKDSTTNSLESRTMFELEQIENIDSLSDETIKALSVIIRTNLQNENEESYSYKPSSNKILNLTKSTDGMVLSSDKNTLCEVSAITGISQPEEKTEYFSGNQTWEVEIKKSKILSFLKQNGIGLSNISSFEPIYDSSHLLTGIKLGGKTIPYETLKNEFGIKSNKITKIENSLTKIIIDGEYVGAFNIDEAEKLSAAGLKFDQILKNLL